MSYKIARAKALGTLDVLQEDVKNCTQCGPLAISNRAFGAGSVDARIMVVAKNPNWYDNQKGEVFTGDSGLFLQRMFECVGIDFDKDVYRTYILACCPNKRKPMIGELQNCYDFKLTAQAQALPNLRCILALGGEVGNMLLGGPSKELKYKLHELRGKWFDNFLGPIRVTYHPYFMSKEPGTKTAAFADLLAVKSFIDRLPQEPTVPTFSGGIRMFQSPDGVDLLHHSKAEERASEFPVHTLQVEKGLDPEQYDPNGFECELEVI